MWVRSKDILRRPGYVLLTAVGIRRSGNRKILGYTVAKGETSNVWRGLINNLQERGLRINELSLLIADGSMGLKKVLKDDFNVKTPIQWCSFHFMDRLSKKIPQVYKKEFYMDMTARVHLKTNINKAKKGIRFIKRKWYKRLNEKVRKSFIRYIDKNIDLTLEYLRIQTPKKHLRYIYIKFNRKNNKSNKR